MKEMRLLSGNEKASLKRPKKRPDAIHAFGGGMFKVQPKIWKACVDWAIKNRTDALAVMYDSTWLASASQMSLDWLYGALAATVAGEAVRHYQYWHHRVHMAGCYGQSIDSSMYKDWIDAGGKFEGFPQKKTA